MQRKHLANRPAPTRYVTSAEMAFMAVVYRDAVNAGADPQAALTKAEDTLREVRAFARNAPPAAPAPTPPAPTPPTPEKPKTPREKYAAGFDSFTSLFKR